MIDSATVAACAVVYLWKVVKLAGFGKSALDVEKGDPDDLQTLLLIGNYLLVLQAPFSKALALQSLL